MYRLKNKWATMTSTGVVSKGIYVNELGSDIFVKGNTDERGLEVYSEILAYIIARNLSIPHIQYKLHHKEEFPDIKVYGDCEHVCSSEKYKESIFQFYNGLETLMGKDNISNILDQYIIKGFPVNYLITTLVFDAFIGNRDRHWNNIHFNYSVDRKIREVPVLDSGASLLYNIRERDLKIYRDTQIGPDKAKPLKGTHREQIHLLDKKFGIPKLFNLSSKEKFLSNVFNDAEEVFQYLSKKRVESIKSYLSNRYDVYIHPYTEYIKNTPTKPNSFSWNAK